MVPSSGGTKVVITGTNLSSVSHANFGGVSAGTMAVDNDTQITATAPAHSGGKVDIEVITSSLDIKLILQARSLTKTWP